MDTHIHCMNERLHARPVWGREPVSFNYKKARDFVFLYIREHMIGDHYVFEEIKEGGRKEKGERK